MERQKYFDEMRKTSDIVNPLIIEAVEPIKKVNRELYEFIVKIPAFEKRLEKKEKLRPFLLRLAYEVAGGKNWEKISHACAAVEILNISTYIDNTFFDNKNDINEKDKINYVISARILRNIAEKLIKKASKKHSERLVELLREIDHDIYVAQFEDTNQLKKDRKFNGIGDFLKAYVHRCEFITGKSMENIARMGGVLANAIEEQIEDIGKSGRYIGIVVQIINDIGDFVPPKEGVYDYEKVYQDQFSDIRLGKLTLPVYYALTFGDENRKRFIKKALGNPNLKNGDLDNVTKTLIESGAIEFTKNLARDFGKKAQVILKQFKNSQAREELEILTKMWQTNKYLKALKSRFGNLNRKKEYLVLIDDEDTPLGIKEKIKVHIDGNLHRAFSVLVFNSKRELLIQQRAKNKYHCGGLWSNTVCSHPKQSESLTNAARRRLKEEMGFKCPLKKIFKFKYKSDFKNGLIENEIDHVFIGKCDPIIEPNKSEVSEYKWISLKKLKKDMKENPKKYTPWFKILMEKYRKIKIDMISPLP